MNDNKLQLGLLEDNQKTKTTSTKDSSHYQQTTKNLNEIIAKQENSSGLNFLDIEAKHYPKNDYAPQLFDNLDDFNYEENIQIKIFGVGGAGNNMINHMANNTNIDSAWLYAINTDAQVLKKMPKFINRILIGKNLTHGLGSGSNPAIGREAILEDKDLIRQALADTDLLFIVSGMGKGTGTGASPIIAELAQEMGILTISLVNLPSVTNEGNKIYQKGTDGLENLKKHTAGILTISNDKILQESNGNLTLWESFQHANKIIGNVICELVSIVTTPSEINVDFNDIKNFFKIKSEFQINTFTINKDEDVKAIIHQRIENEIFQNTMESCDRVIINYHLNPIVTNQFIAEVRNTLEEITNNDNLEITFAIDYNEQIQYASFSIITANNANNISHNDEIPRRKTIDLSQIDDIQDTPIVSETIQESNKETKMFDFENPFIDTNNEFQEIQKEIAEQAAYAEKNLNNSTSNDVDEQLTPTKLNRLINSTMQFKNNLTKKSKV